MRFSERKGYKEVLKVIQTEEINDELRNMLWSCIFERIKYANDNFRYPYWLNYLKKPIDEIPSPIELTHEIKNIIADSPWFEVYDLLEFILNNLNDNSLNKLINTVLENELSGYRFVNGIFTDITNQQEIEMLEDALTDKDFPNVKVHLQRALELLSDRKSPDYRNSIKESISAVESIAKEIAQKPKAELGEALKEIEKNGELHGALKQGFLKLYGYTSDANGIRHSLMEEPNLTADDAKFFLLVCTSFVNYLKTKI